jgi:hypothetical protein
MKRAELDNKSIPCLMCERDVQMGYPQTSLVDIEKANFDQGVECRTYGNYGSQVWDMGGAIFFVICDGCLIKHSAKMLVKERDHTAMNKKFDEVLEGKNPETVYKTLRNARDYYDEWYKWLDEKNKKEGEDDYYRSVSPYREPEK